MTTATLTRRDPRAELDRALSSDLLANLAAARRRRDEADAQIRLLLAYGVEFTAPPAASPSPAWPGPLAVRAPRSGLGVPIPRPTSPALPRSSAVPPPPERRSSP